MRCHKTRRPALRRLEVLENRSLLSGLVALVDTGADLTAGDLSYRTDKPYFDLADSYNAFTQQAATPSGSNVADNSFGGNPGHGHGSTVADNMVAAIQAVAGQPGASSAAPKIMVVRDTNNSGQLDLGAIIRGIYYAADKGANVINVSIGAGYDFGADLTGINDPAKPNATFFTLSDAVNYARSKGAVVVVPAGNDGLQDHSTGVNIDDPSNFSTVYPAYLHTPNMIVAASANPNNGDALYPHSNWGPQHVDLASPLNTNNWQTPGWQTSYASGYAAGITGAVNSLDPGLVGDALASFVKANVQPVASLAGKLTTGGVLSPANLVSALFAPSVATPASATVDAGTGKTASLHVVGADLGGESNLVYTWSVASKPAGASNPSFSINGTNAAKNATATFSAPGAYTFQVTISDAFHRSVTSTVALTVSQIPTSLAISPLKATLSTGGSTSFSATAFDQFGSRIASPGTIQWSVAAGGAGGTINGSGKYVAPNAGGTDQVIAALGTLRQTATVTVNQPTSSPWSGWLTWFASGTPVSSIWSTWQVWVAAALKGPSSQRGIAATK